MLLNNYFKLILINVKKSREEVNIADEYLQVATSKQRLQQ